VIIDSGAIEIDQGDLLDVYGNGLNTTEIIESAKANAPSKVMVFSHKRSPARLPARPENRPVCDCVFGAFQFALASNFNNLKFIGHCDDSPKTPGIMAGASAGGRQMQTDKIVPVCVFHGAMRIHFSLFAVKPVLMR
jgi:hypothetical protein